MRAVVAAAEAAGIKAGVNVVKSFCWVLFMGFFAGEREAERKRERERESMHIKNTYIYKKRHTSRKSIRSRTRG